MTAIRRPASGLTAPCTDAKPDAGLRTDEQGGVNDTSATAALRGIGAAVPRVEDARLLTGQGRYADDMAVGDMAFAYVLRSPHGHARIAGIDKAAALAAPGVLTVLTGADVAAENLAPLRCGSFPKLPPGVPCY